MSRSGSPLELHHPAHPHRLALTVALALLAGSAAHAATVTLQPSADTTIYQGTDPVSLESFEDNSCGGGPDAFSGVTNDGFIRRALLHFDVAGSIPAGAVIQGVTLAIDVNRSGDNQDATMTLHPLQHLWGEGINDCSPIRGGGQGIDAAVGDATWLDALFQQAPWASPGADFGAASASAAIGTRGVYTWDSATNPAMVADVQGWLDLPALNFGWVLVGDEGRTSTTRRFNTREGSSPPTLTIDFTAADAFACCFPDGGCSVTDPVSCTAGGGTPDTGVDTCSPNPCPQPFGACCNPDETCSDPVDRLTCEAGGGVFQGAASLCSDNGVDCGLTPFADALPIPAVLQPVGIRADGVEQYEVRVTETAQNLHSELPDTDVWVYAGSFPGPTIEATANVPLEVTYVNDLPTTGNRRGGHYLEVDECAHGPSYWQDTARVVTHLHGGHTPARFDGQPEHHILPGELDVYEYPNTQIPATLWYHDHALGITRLNVYMGLAGFYLIRDPFEESLGLPADRYEIPLVVQDREFNDDGSFFYPPTIQDAFFGDKVLVNGKVWPFLTVDRGKYRFRLLNGSQARAYRLRLENPDDPAQTIPFELIGTDGGLVSAPLTLPEVSIVPAERLDLVIDFEGFAPGTEIVLRNDDPAPPRVPNVMKFVVGSQTGHTAALPSTLRPVDPIPESEATATRRFRLARVAEPCAGGEWVIQSLDAQGAVVGEHWDDITELPVLGTTEIWEFENPTNLMHPMHVHLVQFQVLDRLDLATGTPLGLDPWETNTWKDTVRAEPGTLTRIILRFEDYPGKFPYHCHLLDHEDHEMMRQFQATHDPAGCDGDGLCESGEDCVSCADCGLVSGALCGNGLCEIGDGEDCLSCPADCAGKQKGGARNQFCCGDGNGIGPILRCGYDTDGFTLLDDRCTTGGFFCRIAPRVAACCGDALCEGQETEASCAVDCTPQGGGGCVPESSKEKGRQCSDGLDNDCDGLIDGDDPDC